ncbi:hypothetical protein PILCRDRAFT_92879 [Piloderma croceum F 1598]|uniref:Uncharacterized protein n=1 Tax=Piloderma croceum (strain F 1598) TaxID=765440 RepID=A0A0C3B910_PILCF|nr:hypothetical protein PILCRDRAFT_92879 [Piloderma croceum F 1598]
MVVIATIFLGSLSAFASATPTACPGMFICLSKLDALAGFTHQGAAKSILLHVALVKNNTAGLQKAFNEVEEYIRPAQDSVDAVNVFLKLNSIKATTLSPTED